MASTSSYAINPGWRLVLRDLGIDSSRVLRRASLPGDLFGRERGALNTGEYFRLWRAIEEESGDPLLALKIGSGISAEAFDPPVFAALCSADLNTALRRIAQFKRLIAPMALHVETTKSATRLGLEWLDSTVDPPRVLVAAELVFFVELGRMGTRSSMIPTEVRAPEPPEPSTAYSDYFGVAVLPGARARISFAADDAALPFLTANPKMWEFFEQDLQTRLAELDQSATAAERTRAALLELLPSGTASVQSVSKKLGTSTRTLQRRLNREGQSFQNVLNETRERLAKHYLKTSSFSGAEISFLLGFEDPNSFFRAFHDWTGTTPEQARNAMRRVH